MVPPLYLMWLDWNRKQRNELSCRIMRCGCVRMAFLLTPNSFFSIKNMAIRYIIMSINISITAGSISIEYLLCNVFDSHKRGQSWRGYDNVKGFKRALQNQASNYICKLRVKPNFSSYSKRFGMQKKSSRGTDWLDHWNLWNSLIRWVSSLNSRVGQQLAVDWVDCFLNFFWINATKDQVKSPEWLDYQKLQGSSIRRKLSSNSRVQ